MLGMSRQGAFLINATSCAGANRDYWSVMVEDVCAALTAAGEDCRPVPFDMAAFGPICDAAVKGAAPPDYLALFNLLPDLQSSGQSIWHGAKVPLLIPCLDHPAHLAETLTKLLSRWRAEPALPCRMIGVMEDTHRPFLAAIGWPAEAVFTFAQGGPPPLKDPRPIGARPDGAVFMGSVRAPVSDADFFATLGIGEPGIRQGLTAAVEETLAGNDDVMAVAMRHLAPHITDPWRLCLSIAVVDGRARTLRRFRLLDSLAGVPITVFGNVEAGAATLLPHCHPAGPLPFPDILARLEHTRVVVNDTINLRGSALIRLYYALSRGCIVATELNDFIAAAFTPGRAVIPVGPDRPDGRAMLEDVLAGGRTADDMAAAAIAAYAAGHTWRHRIGDFTRAIASAVGG